jgi:hypothetical protein
MLRILRRRSFWVTGLLVLFLVGVLLLWLDFMKSATRIKFDRVQLRMSEAEVKAEMGGPPLWQRKSLYGPQDHDMFWRDVDGIFAIYFDADGRVVGKGHQELSLLERFLPW